MTKEYQFAHTYKPQEALDEYTRKIATMNEAQGLIVNEITNHLNNQRMPNSTIAGKAIMIDAPGGTVLYTFF